jgi:DNA-binding MarR family transcriptional regulator
MKDDFLTELGYLALAARFKRLSEAMVHGGRNMYKSLNLDIEPNWYLIFKLLSKHQKLSITKISKLLRFSHPSVISMVKKMKARGYLSTSVDANDSRKQIVKLTSKAHDLLPRLEDIWKAGSEGTKKMLDDNDGFLNKLTNLEIQFREHDFMVRTLKELQNGE